MAAGLLTIAAAGSSVSDLEKHVDYLASPELGGRLTGSTGAQKAADYIVARLEELGAKPLPGSKSFLRTFEFTAGMDDDGSSLKIHGDKAKVATGTKHVQALSFSDTAEVTGDVVFAGYGLTVPEGKDFGYDSYFGLDVKDKVVVVLRYFPEDAEQEVRSALARYSGLRYKALRARELGAKALVVVTGPRSPNAGETIPMTFDTALSGSGIVAVSIDGELGSAIIARAEGKKLEEVQQSLDSGNPHVSGFAIPGLTLTVSAKVARETQTGSNVVGYLPADNGADERFLMLGAHYDHLGEGKHGNSLARKEEAGKIHHGADDNASGVAAVLAVGVELKSKPRQMPVILGFWGGEELGLLGSSHFAKDSSVPMDRIAAYVNFDMVGRVRNNELSLQAVGSSSAWPRLIEQSNVPVGFDLQTQDDPYLPTDAATFYQAKIPTINFFSGSHDDYHRPTDTADRINYEDLQRVVRFASLFTTKLAALDEPPDYLTVARTSEDRGDRDSVRAFTGTIPNYTTEVEGLLLSGVIAGGPADEAGLQEGDVITEFGGQKITNIYDYTYALDAVKIGVPVKVVVQRDGKRVELELTPTSRR